MNGRSVNNNFSARRTNLAIQSPRRKRGTEKSHPIAEAIRYLRQLIVADNRLATTSGRVAAQLRLLNCFIAINRIETPGRATLCYVRIGGLLLIWMRRATRCFSDRNLYGNIYTEGAVAEPTEYAYICIRMAIYNSNRERNSRAGVAS